MAKLPKLENIKLKRLSEDECLGISSGIINVAEAEVIGTQWEWRCGAARYQGNSQGGYGGGICGCKC